MRRKDYKWVFPMRNTGNLADNMGTMVGEYVCYSVVERAWTVQGKVFRPKEEAQKYVESKINWTT